MKKPQVSTCDRPTFKVLNREIYDFAQEIRVAIRTAVDVSVEATISGEDAQIVRLWLSRSGRSCTTSPDRLYYSSPTANAAHLSSSFGACSSINYAFATTR